MKLIKGFKALLISFACIVFCFIMYVLLLQARAADATNISELVLPILIGIGGVSLIVSIVLYTYENSQAIILRNLLHDFRNHSREFREVSYSLMRNPSSIFRNLPENIGEIFRNPMQRAQVLYQHWMYTSRSNENDQTPITHPLQPRRQSTSLNVVTERPRQLRSHQQQIDNIQPPPQIPNPILSSEISDASRTSNIPKAQKKIKPIVTKGVVHDDNDSPLRRSRRLSNQQSQSDAVLLPGQVPEEQATTSREVGHRSLVTAQETANKNKKKLKGK